MATDKRNTGAGRFLARFARDHRGVTALTFALSAMLILAAVFAAVDAARFSAARVQLQDALDGATLAAGVSNATDSATVNKIGKAYIAGQLTNNVTLQNIQTTFTPGAKSVAGLATADVDPVFMDLFTHSLVHIEAKSEVVRGQDETLELAMVLDTTGSMYPTKIVTLKTAATSLVTKVLAGNTKGEVKIGIVPFAQYVNMGIASRTEAWADVKADYSTSKTTTTQTTTTTPSCVKSTSCATQTPYDCSTTNDGVVTPKTCYKGSNCTNVMYDPCPGPVTTPGKTTTTVTPFTFRGCYGSPPYPQNVRDSDLARKYPGMMNIDCSTQVTPMNYNLSTLKTAINALTANGNTYIPAGLAWGFNMLSPQAPITDAAAYDTAGPNRKPRKVLLLMTDGANTKLMNTSTGDHNKSPPAGVRALQADTWTKELCDNIKAQKIEVYTVAFDIGSDTVARDLVKSCATDEAHFYDAADSAALIAAFDAIAASLQALHLSK